MIIFSTSTSAVLIHLPRTVHSTCYDKSGNVIDCTSTEQGEDIQAGVAWPEPRVTTNSDTTLTDYLTGVIWGSNGNIIPLRIPNGDIDVILNDGKYKWSHALDYIAKLNADYLAYNDWCLQNMNELESLVNTDMLHRADWFLTRGRSKVKAEHYRASFIYAGNNNDTENILNGKLKADDQYASQLVYTIQIASQPAFADAQNNFNFILRSLNEINLNLLRIEKVGKHYTVRLGKFENYEIAKKFLQEIKPRVSEAIILKANIKKERIKRLYE